MDNRQKCRRGSGGFTLIELMIVVAIIGILASIAIPSYQVYLIRSRLSEGFLLATTATTAVGNYYAYHGRLPANNQAAGVGPAESFGGDYLARIEIKEGAVSLIFRPEVFGSEWQGGEATIGLSPAIVSGAPSAQLLNWVCGDHQPVAGMELIGRAPTTVPSRYLPSSCQ